MPSLSGKMVWSPCVPVRKEGKTFFLYKTSKWHRYLSRGSLIASLPPLPVRWGPQPFSAVQAEPPLCCHLHGKHGVGSEVFAVCYKSAVCLDSYPYWQGLGMCPSLTVVDEAIFLSNYSIGAVMLFHFTLSYDGASVSPLENYFIAWCTWGSQCYMIIQFKFFVWLPPFIYPSFMCLAC